MEQRVLLPELLPGIPNEITVEHITTKIDYRSIVVLSKVNRAWKQAIRDRLIHNARVRRHVTETFDIRQPDFWGKQFVALDGNVYSLGGRQTQTGEPHQNRTLNHTVGLGYASAEVQVLDLAGCSKNWRMCAPMHEARFGFMCGINDGKMYVAGGWNGHSKVDTKEVYDASNNSWSKIPGKMPFPTHWWNSLQHRPSIDL